MLKIIKLTPDGYFGSNCYLIGSDDEYAVIDPSVSYSRALAEHPEIAGRLKYILLTHAHFDHILKIDSWYEQCKRVIIGAKDIPALKDPYLNCYLGFLGVEDGFFEEAQGVHNDDILLLGGLSIRVIDCPGHTPGGVSYRIDDCIFVGDTVFEKGGYGRCDLPLGDIDALEKTLIKLLTHEADAVIYPGHGNETTIKDIVTYFM